MPNKKSAAKELRKAVKRNASNAKTMAKMKSIVKASLKQIKDNNPKIKEDIKSAMQAIDKAAKKGVIKKNTAARKKSRLTSKANKVK